MIVKADQPSDEGFAAAAAVLKVEEALLRAVALVETKFEGAFLDDGSPPILYERHKFREFTGGKFDGVRISPQPSGILSHAKRGGYGPYSLQHKKLQAAVRLDREAALKSCSWGMFQIMGFNFKACGFENVQDFVNAMWRSANDQLKALAAFLAADVRKRQALQQHDWKTFALLYNGPKYAESRYDKRLEAAYKVFVPKFVSDVSKEEKQ
jgi:hypothetical protein